jgi:hypothetical protein
MSRNATWTNSDGLVVGFGTHSDDNDVAAVEGTQGVKRTQKMRVTLSDLLDAATDASIPPQAAQIPRGSIITDAYVQTIVAAASAGNGATLDIGTWGRGSLTTPAVDDANGFADALTEARMSTVGEIISLKSDALAGVLIAQLDTGGTTVVGTPVGSVSLSDCVVACSYDTEAFTAGIVEITVEYIQPSYASVAAVAL